MIDISSLNPLYIQIPILAILVLGLISGLKDGIVKKLLDTLFLIALIVLMVFIVPPLAKHLEATGIIQNFINKNLEGDLATVISSILTGPVYIFITTVGVMVIYGIIKFVINFIVYHLFKKGLVGRFLGGVWQLIINFVFVAILMVVIASPSIFKGGEELLMNTQGVNVVYGGVVKVQEVLEKNNLPYNLESLFGKMLAGKDATKEDIERYQSTLSRLPSIVDGIKDGSIANDLIDAEGNVNQEKAAVLVDDIIVFSELVNKLPESQKTKLVAPLENVMNDGIKDLFDADGNAKATIEVDSESKEALDTVMTNLSIDAELQSKINKCVKVKEPVTE